MTYELLTRYRTEGEAAFEPRSRHHQTKISTATVSLTLTLTLTRQGLVEPSPKKRPKGSYIRFQAAMPNETWQSDFTHYRLTRPERHTRR